MNSIKGSKWDGTFRRTVVLPERLIHKVSFLIESFLRGEIIIIYSIMIEVQLIILCIIVESSQLFITIDISVQT